MNNGAFRPTLKIFWFAVYRPTHHFTPDPIKKRNVGLFFFFFNIFFLLLFINSLALKQCLFLGQGAKEIFPYLPTQPEHSWSINSKKHIFKAGLTDWQN